MQRMTAREYRRILEQLRLTQAAAARLLGVSLRTSQNYANGHTKIRSDTARLLRAYVQDLIKKPDEG
jgi:DNA-binding transcriptional regulator YiaG